MCNAQAGSDLVFYGQAPKHGDEEELSMHSTDDADNKNDSNSQCNNRLKQ